MSDQSPSVASTIGVMLFMSVWILGWTGGVATIQHQLISGDAPTALGIFLITHGGAQVAVLRWWASSLRGTADSPLKEPKIELEHDGLEARWPNGNGSPVVAITAGLVIGVVHLLLFGSLLMGLATAGPLGWVLAALMFGVWCYTAFHFVDPLIAHFRAQGEVVLEADLDAVTVRIEHALAEVSNQRFPLLGLETTLLDNHKLWIRHGVEEVELPIAGGEESSSLVDLLQTMAQRATEPQNPAIPEALSRLRTEG